MEGSIEVVELQDVDATLRENINIPNDPLRLAEENVGHRCREGMADKDDPEGDEGISMGFLGRNTRIESQNAKLESAEGREVEDLGKPCRFVDIRNLVLPKFIGMGASAGRDL